MFVGNLSFDTSQGELETLFGEVGELGEVFIPTDRDTGRPRGFAFVEFKDDAAATAAIEKFNGFELNGRVLRVNAAEERAPRSGGFGPGGGGRPGGGRFDSKRPRPKGSRRNIRRKRREI